MVDGDDGGVVTGRDAKTELTPLSVTGTFANSNHLSHTKSNCCKNNTNNINNIKSASSTNNANDSSDTTNTNKNRNTNSISNKKTTCTQHTTSSTKHGGSSPCTETMGLNEDPPSYNNSCLDNTHHPDLDSYYNSTYDPFRCLSAMAEQSLTGNFLSNQTPPSAAANHDGSFLFDSSNRPATSGGDSATGPATCNRSNTHSFPCERNIYSTSLPSSLCLTSSSSPRLTSPAVSPISSPDYVISDVSLTTSLSSPAQNEFSRDLTGSDGFMSETRDSPHHSNSPKNFSEIGFKTISKKSYPSCSSEHGLEDSGHLLRWTLQHPESWTSSQVLDWVFFVAQERRLDMTEFHGENFQAFTGAQLCGMGPEDFRRLEPKSGGLLYGMFRKLLCGFVVKKPVEPEELDSPDPRLRSFSSRFCGDEDVYPSTIYPHLGRELDGGSGRTQNIYMKQEQSTSIDSSDNLDLTSYDFDLDDSPCVVNSQSSGNDYSHNNQSSHLYSAQLSMLQSSCCFTSSPFSTQLQRRRPGRPRVKGQLEHDRLMKDKKAKSQHLWEFIYETLMNPLYNPQFLRWESQRDGIFRFVQSESVAQLWGSRKNNENMTYEKLSRAMRHYYRRGILERVEGRRLVYKFSMKAMERIQEKRKGV